MEVQAVERGPFYSGHNKSFSCISYGSYPSPKISWWIDDRFNIDSHTEVKIQFQYQSLSLMKKSQKYLVIFVYYTDLKTNAKKLYKAQFNKYVGSYGKILFRNFSWSTISRIKMSVGAP